MAFGFESTAEQVTEGIDLSGKTWLVTGSNSGLGLESARVLASRGAHIIAAARTEEKAAGALSALGIAGTPIACELSDLASVRSAVAAIKATGLALDGILANAGIMALPELKQKDGIELQLYTNHIGHFALVTGLLDQLSDDARVVLLSSGAHLYAQESGLELDNVSGERDYHPWRMYGRSKLANIMFASALARRFDGTARTANALHPGVIMTNLARHVDNAEAMFSTMKLKTIPQGAATQCYVAVHPDLAGVTGKYFADCGEKAPAAVAHDEAEAEALWKWTESVISGS
ncbi:MAG: WW domain-containing oxidoreductase [Myxococcota bacterium]|jgi:WW domain-containing oxidoreductase